MPTAAFAEAGERTSDAAQQQPGIEVAADDQQQENGAENTGTDKDSNGENGSTSDTEKAEGDANKGAAEDSESQPKSTQQPAEQAAGSEAANAIAAYAATGALTYHSGDLKNNTLWDAVHNAMGKKTTSRYRLTHKATGIQKVIYYDILNPTIDDLASGEYKVEYSSLGNYKECGTFTLQKQFNISNITVNGCETGGLQVNGTDITAPYAVDEGADFSFTVKPVEDFKVESVTVDGTPIQPDASSVYTIANMSSDKSIVATYKADNEATLIATFDNATVKAYGTDLASGAPQTVTAKQDGNAVIEPAEGYAVTSVKLDGTELIDNATFGTYTATVSLGKLEKNSTHTLTVETAKSELATKSNAVGIAGLDKSEYAQRVFRDVVDVNKTVPTGLTANDVTIKYNAGGWINQWQNLDYDPGYDVLKHAFGNQDNETIRISYAGNAQYPGWEKELSVSFTDTRFETKIFMNSSCSLYYNADEASMEENLFNLLQPSVQGEDGKLIAGLTKDDFEFSGLEQKIGEQTVTVKYKGNKEYKPCEATAKVTVVKGKSSLSVSSKSIDYGTTVGINDLVSTTPSNAETKPITVIAGIDGSASGFVGIDFGDVTINDIAGTDIPLIGSQSLQDWITGIIGNEFTVSDLDSKIDTIATALEALGIPESSNIVSALRSISTMLNSIPGLGNATIRIGAAPSNAGVYLVGAATASANYETSFDMGYLTIAPDATSAELEFVHKIGTDVHLTVSDAKTLDYSVQVNGIGTDSANLLVTFAGATDDGDAYMKTVTLKSTDPGMQQKLLAAAPKVPGFYTQTVTTLGGNYFANPISRIYTVNKIKTTLTVDDVTATYDGTPKPATATVRDEDGNKVEDANVEITYSGTSLNGNTYDHVAEAPSEAGSYTVDATYVGTDEYASATATATLTINPDDVALSLNGLDQTYDEDAKAVTVTGAEALPAGSLSITYTGINGTEYGPSTEAPINAGTYKAEVTCSDKNYSIGEVSGTLVVNKANTIIVPTIPANAVYEKNKQWTATATVYADYGEDKDSKIIGTVPVLYNGSDEAPSDVGTYFISASYEGSGNYLPSSLKEGCSFSINPRELAVQIGNYTIFDGEDDPEFTATIGEYVNGKFDAFDDQVWWAEELGLIVEKGGLLNGQENVYSLEIFYTNDRNYMVFDYDPTTGERSSATLTILPSLTVTTEGNGTAAAFDESGQPGKGGAAGTELKLSAAPEDGYEFAGWTVESGDAVVTNTKTANTTLTMGEKSSTVKATFVKKDAPTPPVDPADPTNPNNPDSPTVDNGNDQANNNQANKEQAKSAVQTSDSSLAPITLSFAGTAAAVALAALIMMMRRRRS